MTIETIFDDYLDKEFSAFFYTPPIYPNSFSYLFANPQKIITAVNRDELLSSFIGIEEQLKLGRIGYGYISYEAGYYLENKFIRYREGSEKELLKFCFFDDKNVIKIKSGDIDFVSGGFKKDYDISNLTMNKSGEEFLDDIQKIKSYIEEGDTYQVNYTLKCRFGFSGSELSLFKLLIFNQSAAYSAFINNGENIIISASPELFFSISSNEIVCKPMKGTIKRGVNQAEDEIHRKALKTEGKFHAENLMILDLIRNDLGRISQYNSVEVSKLYSAEKYESLFQLISEVRANLKINVSLEKLFTGLFPCGSITGAPKIRTMEIIKELEKDDRGIYTGAIGMFLKDKTVFNVAIRTIEINKSAGTCEIGIGSGITWDSDPLSEYNETLLKSRFLTEPDNYFELFETMLIENAKVFLLDYHLERLKSSADYFMFVFDENKIREEISRFLNRIEIGKKYRLKLTLNKWGGLAFKLSDFPPIQLPVKIRISDKKISTAKRFQYFKTTNRKLYDEEYNNYSAKGFFDVIFFNEAGKLAEGAITNIFIRKGGIYYTPDLNSGILPGVYRRYFIENNLGVVEKPLSYSDLADADQILLTNSLRGEIKVDQLVLNRGSIEAIKEF